LTASTIFVVAVAVVVAAAASAFFYASTASTIATPRRVDQRAQLRDPLPFEQRNREEHRQRHSP
jgi:hypothetical protein